jgi:hypothetical protein
MSLSRNHFVTRLIFAFFLAIGGWVGLHAESLPEPEVPGLYTDLMPSILVKDVDLETLPDLVQPEYLLWDDLPITVTATGLPAGLRLAERRVVGKPTRLGLHRVTFRVSNEYGMSRPVVWVVQVVDEPQTDFGPGGSFFGVSRVNDAAKYPLSLRIARLQVEVTPVGVFSGHISILGDKRSFAGQLRMDPEDATKRRAVIRFRQRVGKVEKVKLALIQVAKPGFERWFDAVVEADDLINAEARLLPRLVPTAAERKTLRGRMNLHLEDQVYNGGIASLHCSAGLKANLTGLLPDGSGFTTSSPLVRLETLAPGFLVGYDDGRYGNLIGQIEVNRWPEPSFRAQVGGVLQWHIVHRPGPRPALFDDVDINFQVSGGTYVPPSQGDLLLSGASKTRQNAQLLLRGAAYHDQTFTLTAAHQALFPPGAENPFQAKIDFYAPTGFFTGQIQVLYVLPGPVSRQATRRAYFRGLISQLPGSGSTGHGFYSLPSYPDPDTTPPTTLKNSMLLPGSVKLLELNL